MSIQAVLANDKALAFNPFEGRDPDEIIQVSMKNGNVLTGKYFYIGRMHFIEKQDPDASLGSRAFGPIQLGDVSSVEVVKDAAQVRQERFEFTRGDRVPGPVPESREDFRYRLELLARAFLKEPGGWRKYQLELQFNDCADMIGLAKAKRAWLLAETKWYLEHNRPPEMSDLWRADMASPSLLKKPNDQDFDPDPVQRRKRVPYPEDVIRDPLSVPNVLNRIKGFGGAAYISLAAEKVFDKATICVNFPDIPGRNKVYLTGKRTNGFTTWTVAVDCGNSRIAFRRMMRIKRHPLYVKMVDFVRPAGR
jgi:hypothetical protein